MQRPGAQGSVPVKPELEKCVVRAGGGQAWSGVSSQDGEQHREVTGAWTLTFGRSGLDSIDHSGCVALGLVRGVLFAPQFPLTTIHPTLCLTGVGHWGAAQKGDGKIEEREGAIFIHPALALWGHLGLLCPSTQGHSSL